MRRPCTICCKRPYNIDQFIGVMMINSLQAIWDGFDFTYILSILLGVIPSLLCISLHELSHGLVAYKLGDDTAKRMGRLTFNPLRHLDPMGLLMMLVFRVGWAKPVPVNMYRFTNPKRGMAITALAGPVTNIVLSAIFLFLYGFLLYPLNEGAVGRYVLAMIQLTASMSIGLAVFNLLPVPPLDGSKVLFSLIRDESYYKLMRYEHYGSIAMFLLVATGLLGKPLSAAIDALFSFSMPVAQTGLELFIKIFVL